MLIQQHQAVLAVQQQHLSTTQRQVLAHHDNSDAVSDANVTNRARPVSADTGGGMFTADKLSEAVSTPTNSSASDQSSVTEAADVLLAQHLVEMLAGKKLHWYRFDNSPADAHSPPIVGPAQRQRPPEQVLLVKSSYSDLQRYQLSVDMQLQTTDGKAQRYAAILNWQQLNQSSTTQLMTQQQLDDPLVLNFDWQAVGFAGATQLDLNGDGKQDRLPTPTGNSGYLVIDNNHNGKVDNASEVVGAKSGDGWADITAMDNNQDGVLDSRDSAFGKLYWWQPGKSATLTSLSDKKVDGLVLQAANTHAQIAPNNQPLGNLRRSGVFIHDGGQLGVVQQFDFYV